MITIDGSVGEGGGQVLRTSLGLSLVTGQEFQIKNLRGGRKKPGLLRQHLTAVNAAAEVGNAAVTGNELGSMELRFKPKTVRAGQYAFAVATAGSVTLVLQTILPSLMRANGPSDIVLRGGTHNPFAPPFDFLLRSFLPLVNRMGPAVSAHLVRRGFYPAGGGEFRVHIDPASSLTQISLTSRGRVLRQGVLGVVSKLPRAIAEREIAVLAEKLSWPEDSFRVEEDADSPGTGNVVLVEIESEHVTEVFAGFGEKGISSDSVARSLVKPVREYLSSDIPVGRYLADQLLVPMALAGGGEFLTLPLTPHTTTNADVIHRFLDAEVAVETRSRLGRLVRIVTP